VGSSGVTRFEFPDGGMPGKDWNEAMRRKALAVDVKNDWKFIQPFELR
jgi:hypothetical protein